jgi:hypothetical protein
MKAKPQSVGRKRRLSLHVPQHYRIALPPPGCREVGECLEFHLLNLVPWIPEQYHLEPAEQELLARNGLYHSLNLEAVRSYVQLFNRRLEEGLNEKSFFATEEPTFEGLAQCHGEAVKLWTAYQELYQETFQGLHDQCERNGPTLRDLVRRLEHRKRDVVRLQQCMARLTGKRTDPIIDILKMTHEEPAVTFGGSLVATRRDLETLENHCKLQQIAIADARLLLRLVERGFMPGTD